MEKRSEVFGELMNPLSLLLKWYMLADLKNSRVKEHVSNAWGFADGRGNKSVSARIKACRKSLSALKKRANMNSRSRIEQAEIALERKQSAFMPSTATIQFLKRELMRAQKDEETYWWQKSKDKWLSGGDRNSRFFHNLVKASRQRNSIVKLVNSEGVEVFSEPAKGEVATEFYARLFQSSNPSPFTSWFSDMRPQVSPQMNEELTKPVFENEVKEAVFSIKPSKAPGPDGMSALFFQKFWHVIREQFVKEVQLFFETRLSHLLRKAEREGRVQGIMFGETGPSVNHMLFADDCLIACKANDVQSSALQEIFTQYADVTGQMVNLEKSSIIFGRGVLEENKTRMKQKLGIVAEGGEGKYLGLPEVLKSSKVQAFSYLKERMSKKISGWHAKTLSQGGKEVLLKVVAAALPIHAMSVYKIPKTVISSLHSIMASFWWSNVEYKRRIHWLSWDKFCLPKENGGMGFIDIQCFNQALLAQQAWRITQYDQSLLAQVLRGKYFPNKYLVNAQLGSKPSYAWRSLLYGRDLLITGLKHLVGDGSSLHVWSDAWLEDDAGCCKAPIRRNKCFDANLRVSDLIDYPKRRWDRQKLEELFIYADVNVLMMNQPAVNDRDSWAWRLNKSGAYSVSSGYKVAFSALHQELIKDQAELPSINPLKAEIWNLKAPSKIKVFMWKALAGALSVLDNLRHQGMKCDSVCQTCGMDGESITMCFSLALFQGKFGFSLASHICAADSMMNRFFKTRVIFS
ncbi:uncharacterized protein LOC108845308 [Raphanus sativus]|uniref:Uncharacterized protein LOC108845308 n=1 Tax=Raphanus sativus TaxID=3726 RepID=A0A6J0MPH5_RAPSA|nr:uncharacterized protein LOC108845308 [Raphanus sativus]